MATGVTARGRRSDGRRAAVTERMQKSAVKLMRLDLCSDLNLPLH